MIAYLGSLKPPFVTPPPVAAYDLDYVVVAGGGGGGSAWPGNNFANGGGGAGGYLSGTLTAQTVATYSIIVGAGGIGRAINEASSGGSNTFLQSTNSTVYTIGGGSDSPRNGGSGAGAYHFAAVGLGTAGQGNNGGTGPNGYQCGGGGGASQAGAPGNTTAKGGDGLTWVDGITRAGGGGGTRARNDAGVLDPLSGLGGSGGGGRGANGETVPAYLAEDGTQNTGGGGGIGYPVQGYQKGGNGGSGVVKVRYLGTPRATGGIITQSGGYTYHEFKFSGILIFTS